MARFKQTAEERRRFEAIVLWAIEAGFSYTEELREIVREALLRERKPWATGLARMTDFNTKLRSVLNKLRNEGRIACDKQSTRSRWRIADAGAQAYEG